MAKMHEGVGGNHSGGRSLALKVRSLGFFQPTMNTDCESYARRCDKCQRHAPSIHCPTEMLRTTTAPYPFMRWAMDIIGPLPNSRQRRFILVLTNYFTKWIKADAFAQVEHLTEPFYPPPYTQRNGQAESSNKLIVDGIKKCLDLKKGH